jgi:Thiolase C-terminal domain-like
VEAVRQLFGEGGKRQVSNTKNAVVTGIGGIPYGRNWGTSTVMILTPDA